MAKRLTSLLTFVIALVSLCASCSSPGQREEAADQERENARLEVLEIGAQHGADFNWLLSWRGYTLQLQEALLEPPGRSHMLIASVDDVFKSEQGYFLTAHDSGIYFRLGCDAEQAQYVLSAAASERPRSQEYAIVMRPESVHKPVAQLAAEKDEFGGYVFHEAAEVVIVNGTCVDILSLEDSGLSLFDFFNPDSE